MIVANKLLNHVHALPPREQAHDKQGKHWVPDAKEVYDACWKGRWGFDWVINALPLHDPKGMGGYQHVGKSINILRGIFSKSRACVAREMLNLCLDFLQETSEKQNEISVMVYCKSGRHRIRLEWGMILYVLG